MASTLSGLMKAAAQQHQHLKDFEAHRRQEQVAAIKLQNTNAAPLLTAISCLAELPADSNGRRISTHYAANENGSTEILVCHTNARDQFARSHDMGFRRAIVFTVNEQTQLFSTKRYDIRDSGADEFGVSSLGGSAYTCLTSLAQWCGRQFDDYQMPAAALILDQAEASFSAQSAAAPKRQP